MSELGKLTMSTSITLNLPDEVYRRASELAQLMSIDLADVLVEAISLSLSPMSSVEADLDRSEETPVASLSDEEVLALTELQMETNSDQRLSELLDRQQAGILTEAERPELWTKMQIYQFLLLRKAIALREAVSRGLHSPLEA